MNQQRHYVVAMRLDKEMTMVTEEGYCYNTLISRDDTFKKQIKPLYTGKLYTLEEAEARVKELNKTCGPELKVLDYDRYVVYNIHSEHDD